jgi:hypothetical protein
MGMKTAGALVVCGLALGALSGCEDGEAKCKAAEDTAHTAVREVLEAAVARQRETSTARDEAKDALARALMDLGNVRSEAVLAAQGSGNDAAVGVEVAVGAMVAAVLGSNEISDDAAAADALLAKMVEAMDGPYRQLMTGPHEGEEAGTELARVGDSCATALQLAVRELPEGARARVLDQFQTMEAAETAPAEDTSFEKVTTAFAAYRTALAAAREAKARSDAATRALDAVRGPATAAREAFDAVPSDDSPAHGAAAAAVGALVTACAE